MSQTRSDSPIAIPRSAVWLALVVLGLVVVRSAWMGDDAYVTMRTVDNIVHGHGAVWNLGERVQAYTHPLWMLLLVVAYGVTRDAFVVPMVLAAALSIAAAWYVARNLGKTPTYAWLVLVALGLSRSYVDYSTSGLENSLSHGLLALFIVGYARFDGSRAAYTKLALWIGLLAITRMDLLVLVGPALLFAGRKRPRLSAARSLVVGFSPWIAWEAFSLVYYGSLVPNTAVAKLAHGIPSRELWRQGFIYVIRQLDFDPVSVVLIGGALVATAALARREREWAVVGLGIALYTVYVAKIGGGFMAGRFFTAPILVSVCLLVAVRQRFTSADSATRWKDAAVGSVGLVLLGFMANSPTLIHDRAGATAETTIVEGIVDERRFWGRDNALVGVRRIGKAPYHGMVANAITVRKSEDTIAVRDAVGMFGFHVGPAVKVVDRYALGDAFLARLPASTIDRWRPGHMQRYVPPGYVDTLRTGESHLVDEDLAKLWSEIHLVAAGPLFSAERWAAIWRINTGQLDHLVDRELYRKPYLRSVPARVLARPVADGSSWDTPGSVYVDADAGLRVELDQLSHATEIRISAGTNDAYRLTFMDGDTPLGEAEFAAMSAKQRKRKRGAYERAVIVPAKIAQLGYDSVQVDRAGDDRRLAIGHFILGERVLGKRVKPSRPKKGRTPKQEHAPDDASDASPAGEHNAAGASPSARPDP